MNRFETWASRARQLQKPQNRCEKYAMCCWVSVRMRWMLTRSLRIMSKFYDRQWRQFPINEFYDLGNEMTNISFVIDVLGNGCLRASSFAKTISMGIFLRSLVENVCCFFFYLNSQMEHFNHIGALALPHTYSYLAYTESQGLNSSTENVLETHFPEWKIPLSFRHLTIVNRLSESRAVIYDYNINGTHSCSQMHRAGTLVRALLLPSIFSIKKSGISIHLRTK